MTQSGEVLAWLDDKPTLARSIAAARKLDQISGEEFTERRVAIVRNFTIEPIEPALKVAAYRLGMRLHVDYSGYEPAAEEATLELTAGADLALVMLRLDALVRDLTPALVDEAVSHLVALASRIRSHSRVPLLVHNFDAPEASLVDTQDPDGHLNLVRRANVELAARLADHEGIHLVDVDHVLSGIGRRAAEAERGGHAGEAPLSREGLGVLAEALVRHIRALAGPRCKCIVVDCDDTLWGGVLGEDGIAGIEFAERHLQLHRTLLDLRRRGTLLAIASKNDEADVLEVLRTHPECALSEEDFAALRVNWEDKVSNLEEIARELNLGLGKFAFLDDNPVECDRVRRQLPEVHVVQWPAKLDDLGLFDSLVLTNEDRNRTAMYRAERERRAARREVTSKQDYLRTLEMVATVGFVGPERLARVTQLIQKTNQFNLTVRRHDAAALERMCADADTGVVWLELDDCFGSNGLVGCGIVRRDGDRALIDTLLISCRVIGREVERVLVRRLAAVASDLGASSLIGEYRPAERNGQVADLYPRLGFTGPPSGPWRWSLDDGLPEVPEWLEVVDLEGAPA